MSNKKRIDSIQRSAVLDSRITRLPTFDLSELILEKDVEVILPTNLRLGHLAERAVSGLIKASSNYEVVFENLQLVEDSRTIGEIDFILTHRISKKVIHVELAYKFYLYDPSLSSIELNNWIGPNRNDSLKEKLEKVRNRQFPLLFHEATRAQLGEIPPEDIEQQLCLMAHLFIPYEAKVELSEEYQEAVQGYYITARQFKDKKHLGRAYCLPRKTDWGMNPADNDDWRSMEEVAPHISKSLSERQSVLCWEEHQESYSAFFIVWW